jgi:hypothetical protein
VGDCSSLTRYGLLIANYRTFTAHRTPSEEPQLPESVALSDDESRQSERFAREQRPNKLADEDDVFRESGDDTARQESSKSELGVERPVLVKERRLTLTIPARPKKADAPKKAPKEEEEDLTDDSAHVSSAVQEDESTPSPTNRPAMGQHSFSLPEVPLMQRGNIYHQHGGRSAAAAMVTQLPGRPMQPQPARRAPPPPPPAPSPGPSAPSPTASQGAQVLTTSQVPTTSQATRSVSRHPSYASSPVTRSHCKFHKIDVELVDFGPRIIFIVPGCSLVNREFMKQEEIFDLGDVTPEDTHAMEGDIRSLDISGEIISNLLLLVGVEREHEIFYLPQADVPVGRKQRRKPLKLEHTSVGRSRKRDSMAQSARAGASAAKRRRTDDRASTTPSVSSVADSVPPPQRQVDATSASMSDVEGGAPRDGTGARPPAAASTSAAASTPSASQKAANPSDARKQRRAPATDPSVFEDAESYESTSASEDDDGDVYQPRSPAPSQLQSQSQSQSRKRRRPTVGEGKSSPHKKTKTE